jgi:ABC-2 type transport system ATP-binding protein
MTPVAGRPETDGEVVTATTAAGDISSSGVTAAETAVLPEDIVARLVEAGIRVRGFSVERESLEDRFVALTGEGFDVAQ